MFSYDSQLTLDRALEQVDLEGVVCEGFGPVGCVCGRGAPQLS
jgi:hypothetical protein